MVQKTDSPDYPEDTRERIPVILTKEDNHRLWDLCEWLNSKPLYSDLGIEVGFEQVVKLAFRRGLTNLLQNLEVDSWPPVDMSPAPQVVERSVTQPAPAPEPEEITEIGPEYAPLDDVGEMPLPPWEDIHSHGDTISFYDPAIEWHPNMKGRYGDLLDYYVQEGWLAFVGHTGSEMEAFLLFWAPSLENNLQTPPFRSEDFRVVPVEIVPLEDSQGYNYGNAHFVALRGV